MTKDGRSCAIGSERSGEGARSPAFGLGISSQHPPPTGACAALSADLGAETSYLGHGEDLVHLRENDGSDKWHLRVCYFPCELCREKKEHCEQRAL